MGALKYFVSEGCDTPLSCFKLRRTASLLFYLLLPNNRAAVDFVVICTVSHGHGNAGEDEQLNMLSANIVKSCKIRSLTRSMK